MFPSRTIFWQPNRYMCVLPVRETRTRFVSKQPMQRTDRNYDSNSVHQYQVKSIDNRVWCQCDSAPRSGDKTSWTLTFSANLNTLEHTRKPLPDLSPTSKVAEDADTYRVIKRLRRRRAAWCRGYLSRFQCDTAPPQQVAAWQACCKSCSLSRADSYMRSASDSEHGARRSQTYLTDWFKNERSI